MNSMYLGGVTIVGNDVGGRGGMERQLGELIGGLQTEGIPVTVVSRTLVWDNMNNLSWIRVPGPKRPFPIAFPWFYVAASFLVRRHGRGLVHTTGAIVMNRADVATVHFLHNRTDRTINRASRQSTAFRANSWVADLFSRVVERHVYRSPKRSRSLVAVSGPLGKELVEAFPSRATDIAAIANGVDPLVFRPNPQARKTVRSALELGPTVLVAVFVGSEWNAKGLAIAVEALTIVERWHLVVVGSGDSKAITTFAENAGVLDRIHVVGPRDHPEDYLAAADAFVLPSAHETFSLATVEAAAVALPVVATAVGIVPDLAAAGGALIVERNAESVATALRRIEDDRDLGRTMGEHARAFASTYSWAASTKQYIELYERLLTNGPATDPSAQRRRRA